MSRRGMLAQNVGPVFPSPGRSCLSQTAALGVVVYCKVSFAAGERPTVFKKWAKGPHGAKKLE